MIKRYISLLPFYTKPTTIFVSDKLPCHAGKVESSPIQCILGEIQRERWAEGLYVRKRDLARLKRYKNPAGQYKNNFDETQFLQWVKSIEENTVICEMENKNIGKGVFVAPGKKFLKGTFIASSGLIKLVPTRRDLETKNHCSALQDLDSPERKIYGLIDPAKKGGILDLINHAPNEDEIANFNFKNSRIKEMVATSNLQSTIKFYEGYAVMGVEAIQDINGGKYGKQLLWSYAQPDEYLPDQSGFENSTLLLFDNRDEYNGEIIDANNYSLKKINIFLDTGEMVLRKVASLTRWELMKNAPETGLVFTMEDPYSSTQSEAIQSPILHMFLQTYLKENPVADRVIIKIPPGDISAVRSHVQ